MRSIAAAICSVALLVTSSRVYAQANRFAWERVGTEQSGVADEASKGISFLSGTVSDGSQDTLFVGNGGGVFRLNPGALDWSLVCAKSICRNEVLVVTKEGNILIGMKAGPSSGGVLSTDGGQSWQEEVIGPYGESLLYQSTLPALDGRVIAGNATTLGWSFEGGAAGTWVFGEPLGGFPVEDIAEVQPSDSIPDGRLLGGVWNGAVYSDDGGQTWTQSSLFGEGHLIVNSLTFGGDPDHPFGGVAYAGTRDDQIGYPAIFRSDDGGVTWNLVHSVRPGDYGVERPYWIVVKAGPAGSIYAGINDATPGPDPGLGPIIASFDGGATWSPVADSTNGWGGYGTLSMLIGRDRRMYVGTEYGVWRSVNPIPVGVETTPKEQPVETGMVLEVAPNPFRQRATVRLTLDAPSTVRISVFDVLGREVAVLADGRSAAGPHEFAFQPDGLAAGVYFVRALVRARQGRATVATRSVVVVE